MPEKIDKSRRQFLKSSGWVAVGVSVLFSTGCSLPVLPTSSDDAEDDVNAWLQMRPDGRVYLFVGKAEMGQGIMTALSQLVAEEMRIPFEKIVPVIPTTDEIPAVRMTVGSESIKTLFMPIRQAASRLQQVLIEIAAEKNHLSTGDLVAVSGGLKVIATSELIDYRQIAHEVIIVDEAKSPSLISTDKFQVIGQSVKRTDLLDKVTGKAQYSHDIKPAGLLHGVVLTPAVYGAKLIDADISAANGSQGVITVVYEPENDFVGIVAKTALQAKQALSKVKAKWDVPKVWQQKDIEKLLDTERLLREEGSGHNVRTLGDVVAARAQSRSHLDRKYWTPLAAHAAMETHAAVAHVTYDRLDLWLSTQDAFYQRAKAAKLTGMSKEQVIVHPTLLGGAFGGKVGAEAAMDAVRLSNAIKKPVSVVWSREETFFRGYFKTPSLHHIRAGVGKRGQISYWQHHFASGPIIFSPAFLSAGLQWATSFFTDKGGARGAGHPYEIANQEIRYWDETLPVPTGAWRGLGSSTNAFAIESAMDELAHAAEIDPLEFRLRHLGNGQQRLQRVLKAAAERAQWGRPAGRGKAQGLACGIYKDETYVAVIAEVSEGRGEHPVHVDRLICAHDCGLVVNPDQVKAQIEGNLIWGCGSALKEELRLENGTMHAKTFDQYGLIRFDECPEIDIVLVEDVADAPTGAGEPALMPTPAAIANAASRLLGRRITRLPIR